MVTMTAPAHGGDGGEKRAWLSLRFGKVEFGRPRSTRHHNLPKSVASSSK
jgi:hypothetical protein